MIVSPIEVNFSRYKRYFSFGCSFTFYKWPTWSHLLHSEMTNVSHINLGRSGAGNLMTSSRIIEADARYKFSETDFVAVMWTTFCREDRWIDKRGGWIHPGNIYTQDEYDEGFVSKYCDPLGYLIRDMALIAIATKFMEQSSATFFPLLSVPFTYQQDTNESRVDEILNIYSEEISMFPPSLFNLEMNQEWTPGHSYYSEHHRGIFKDYHPSPIRYWNYLDKLKLPLTNISKDYATRSTEQLLIATNEKEIEGFNFNHSIVSLKMF